MSEHIEFTPNGFLLHKWSAKQKKYILKIPKKKTICTHLRSKCVIADGTTLRHIFEEVDKYKLLKIVIAQYSWCFSLNEFHEQAKLENTTKNENEKIDYLEIYHSSKTNKTISKVKHPGGLREKTITMDYETYIEFHGIRSPSAEYSDILDPNKKIGYSVSYSPMWEIADLPVKLNTTIEIFEAFDPNKHNYKQNNIPQKILTKNRDFTLLEVLDAIYWDISFMGGPEDNANFIDTINKRLKDYDENKDLTIPLEDLEDLENLENLEDLGD